MKQIFIDSNERFGSRKIKFALMQQGYTVGETHISRLMREMNLVCKQVRLRYLSTTNRKYKYYRNKVQRKFITESPNLIWVSDITHVYVKNIDYSIGVIIDLYARKVIAFDIAEQATVEFILKIFDYAFDIRQCPTGLTFHSDQGSLYTAFKFRKHLRKLGVKQSFSNPGPPLDNAVAESFFACMKREELSHNYYDCVEDLRHDVSNYIDFFNNMRPHQRLGMQTPAGVEAQFMAEKNSKAKGCVNVRASEYSCREGSTCGVSVNSAKKKKRTGVRFGLFSYIQRGEDTFAYCDLYLLYKIYI